jgi:hypothetical protein
MGEALPSSIQAIVANRINNSNNLLRLIDRLKADHEEQRRKLKNRITPRRIYRESASPTNRPATREWQNNGNLPQTNTEVAKNTLATTNRFSALETEEAEEEPEEEEDEYLPPAKTPTPFTHETKEAEDFLQQNHNYQQAIGVTSPIVKTTLALKFVKGDELESWRADLEQWIDALNIEEDDIPLVWDLFVTELKGQARRNKSNVARQQLANLRMEEGQLRTYINKFEELAEQAGFAQADPATTHTFITGLTTSLQDRVNSQPIYGYHVARARAIQEDQKQYTVLEALRARQQQRQRLIDRIRKRHEPVQDEGPSTRFPTIPVQCPLAIDHSNQPRDQTTVIPEAPVEKQHPITVAIRTKRERPVSAEYSSQPEDESTAINPSESIAKRQRMTEHLPVKEMAKEQGKHNTAPKEEPRPMKRPVAVDYFDRPEDTSTTISSDEPLSKKQRIASIEVRNPSNADHIRSSNTDVYILA